MTIPTLPSAPLVTDIPADFNTKAFNWVAALDNWTTEANATGVAADADAATATSAAGTATTQAGTATTQAGIATSAASTATTQAGIATTKAGEANASAVAAAASAASINLNSIDINGGTIDGTVIGGSSAAAVSATTLSATHANGFGITSKTNDATAANNAGVLTYGVASATAATRRSILFLDPNGGDGSGGDYVALDVYGNGTFTIANEISGGVINLGIGGTDRASVSSTGLAVTGALSATDTVTSTYVGGSPAFNASAATTGIKYAQIGNTGGALLLGMDSSSGGGLGTPATAYDAILRTATALTIGNATNQFARVSSTGLAVTGALSASDSIRGGSGATYKFALDYSVSGDVAGELANSHASGYGYRIKGGTTSNYALLVQSQDSTNILEAKKGSVAVTGALSATGGITNTAPAATSSTLTLAGSGAYSSSINLNGGGGGSGVINVQSSGVLLTQVAGATVTSTSASGLAVTGALSATGAATTVFGASMSAGQTFGPAGTGGGVFINTSSLSASYNSGLAIDGSYAGGAALSTINLKALGVYSGGGYASNLAFWTSNETTASEKMRLDASGNLGLGVTPSAWYGTKIFETVSGCGLSSWAGYSTYGLVQNNYHDGASWKYKTTNFASRFCANDGNVGGFQWYTAPSGTAGNAISFTQAMTLDASGGLIIGHTSGGTADTNSFASDRAGYIVQNHVTGTATATPFAYFAYAGGSIGTITQSGTTAVLYNTTSDARLKENITDASDAASLIDALQVRQFDWKSDGSHQRYGFVAQELYEVAPEAVSKPQDPDEMMAVDYSKLVPMLVKEIQSLRQRVAQLEGI